MINTKAKFNPNGLTERVLQFGDGVFLRAYMTWMIDHLNKHHEFNTGIHITQPRSPKPSATIQNLKTQDHKYTVLLQGLNEGKEVSEPYLIDSVLSSSNAVQEWDTLVMKMENPDLRFIVSNTTEAGIEYAQEEYIAGKPQKTFPAKLTSLLYKRFEYFKGDASKGFLFLPCELIEGNGSRLKEYILKYSEDWNLGSKFSDWIEKSNFFANTLVDKIVSGYPEKEHKKLQNELGYEDKLMVSAEPYHLLVIEGDPIFEKEIPFSQSNLNVIFTNNLDTYRNRKVKILNGAHTLSVLLAYLQGFHTVKDMMQNDNIRNFISTALKLEVIPTIEGDKTELLEYYETVLERFANPYINHKCINISMNSISKFKVRLLPTLLDFVKLKGELPPCLCLSLALLILFYKVTKVKAGIYYGATEEGEYPIQDDPMMLEKFKNAWNNNSEAKVVVDQILSDTDIWTRELIELKGLKDKVSQSLELLINKEYRTAIESAI